LENASEKKGRLLAVQQAMGIEDRVAQAAAHQQAIQALVVGTLRQPDALWAHPQQPLVFAHGCEQLGSHGLGRIAQQRQVAVGGGAGEEIQHPRLLQPLEAR